MQRGEMNLHNLYSAVCHLQNGKISISCNHVLFTLFLPSLSFPSCPSLPVLPFPSYPFLSCLHINFKISAKKSIALFFSCLFHNSIALVSDFLSTCPEVFVPSEILAQDWNIADCHLVVSRMAPDSPSTYAPNTSAPAFTTSLI